MSSERRRQLSGIDKAPYVGALLRMAHQGARARILQALAERGLGDINQAYFALFQYPPIDGIRPADVAKRLGMSRQAVNHLLGQLEKLGYLNRRRDPANGHIAVYYTERGWQVLDCSLATMHELETDWQRSLGKQRFADFKKALQELAGTGR